MTQLKAGIIGLGVGEKHIEGYNSHPECKVVALCDFSEEKLAAAKQKYPHLKITPEVDEILEDPEIDVVSIASYDNYHYEQIAKAIKNKKHVFVEKPFCLYEKEARHIRKLLHRNSDLKLSSNLILRMSPRFRLLRDKISNGEMGKLFYVEGDYNYGRLHKITDGWRGKIDFYSVVYGGGVHIIDLLLWLTGDHITDVAAYGTDIASEGTPFKYNDMVVCVLRFKSGMIGKMAVNFGCVHPHFHVLSVYGTNATFQNGMEYGMLFESRDASVEPERITAPYPGTQKGDLINSFLDSILNGSEAEVSMQDVFETMSVCFAIEKATYQEGFVSVDYIK